MCLNTRRNFVLEDKLIQQWRIQDFPLGGADPLGGRQPPTRTPSGKNVCENKRN